MAEQTLNVVVQEVTHQSGTSKKTGKPYDIYLIKLSDGNEYKTFNEETGAKANEYKGQPVKAKVAQKGEDFWLNDVEPAEGVPAPVVPMNGTEARVLTPIQAGYSTGDNIRAQMAFKAAAQYYSNNGSGDVETDLPLIEAMAKVLYQKATAEYLASGPQKAVTEQW
jgi:hypothetical protein